MYPKVFNDFIQHKLKYGTLSTIPSSVFFYGLQEQIPVSVELEQGKTLEIKLLGRSEAKDGLIDLFIELNGQLRLIQIKQKSVAAALQHPQVDPMNPAHIGASMPGMISTIPVKLGQSVAKGETLFTIEAMKMELAIKADTDCIVQKILVGPGKQVKNKDLVLVVQ